MAPLESYIHVDLLQVRRLEEFSRTGIFVATFQLLLFVIQLEV